MIIVDSQLKNTASWVRRRIFSMKCPMCGEATEVRDSRPRRGGFDWHRRRRCTGCDFRFSTREVVTPGYFAFYGATGSVLLADADLAKITSARKALDVLEAAMRDSVKLLSDEGAKSDEATP
jgi:transposase-like protein